MKKKFIVLGPLPPPLGGTTVLFEDLAKKMANDSFLNIVLIDTALRSSSRIGKLWSLLIQLVTVLSNLPSADLIALHASSMRFIIFGSILRFLCSLFRVPLVLRLFGGGLIDIERSGAWPLRFLLKYCLGADLILMEAKGLVDYFRGLWHGKELRWFPNSRPSVNLPAERAPREDLKGINFVFISTVCVEKGVLVALDAVTELRGEFKVKFYGSLSDNLDRHLFYTDRVEYCGEVHSSRVPEILTSADFLLLPSFYKGECYPGVIIEAFRCGVPVISTKWKFIPEVVSEGYNGLLVEPESVEGLRQALQSVIDSEILRNGLKSGAVSSKNLFMSSVWNERFVNWCKCLVTNQAVYDYEEPTIAVK